jgi:hypothetical protein
LETPSLPLSTETFANAALRECDGTKGSRARYRRQSLGPDSFIGRHFMSVLISILITFVVVILVLYLVNMLPIDGRAKQIIRVVVIIIGIISLLRYLAVF